MWPTLPHQLSLLLAADLSISLRRVKCDIWAKMLTAMYSRSPRRPYNLGFPVSTPLEVGLRRKYRFLGTTIQPNIAPGLPPFSECSSPLTSATPARGTPIFFSRPNVRHTLTWYISFSCLFSATHGRCDPEGEPRPVAAERQDKGARADRLGQREDAAVQTLGYVRGWFC